MPGNIYTRITNPTVDVFEKRVALLEGGTAAVGLSSGMAAIAFSILNITRAGDEIVAATDLYGGTYNLFAVTLPKYGINVKFVDPKDPENFRKAITPKTKALFGEIIGGIQACIYWMWKLLRTSPMKMRSHLLLIAPLQHHIFASRLIGEQILLSILQQKTKWIGGHGTVIGGVVVDAGKFDWDNEKFPDFVEPDETYHGLRYGIDVPNAAFATKLRVQLLRDFGPCLSPDNAFQLLQGLETLHLRIDKHIENAKAVAEFLVNHDAIEWVSYPGLENHPSYELAHKYFPKGAGSIIVFGIKGGREAGRQTIDHVKLWSHVANVGDAKSLIIHPASTTHQQLSAEELKLVGVTEELIRVSVGLEAVEDIIADLGQAIDKAVEIVSVK